MSKVVLITTKQPPDWESWKKMKSRERNGRSRIIMTQTEALAIFQVALTAGTTEDAVQFLMTKMVSRKPFSYWLGQIGRKALVKLGRGKTFPAYVDAVVKSLRNKVHDDETLSEKKEEENMGKKEQKPVVVKKRKAQVEGNESSQLNGGTHIERDNGFLATTNNVETSSQPAVSQTAGTVSPKNSKLVAPSGPQIPGFDLDDVSLQQQYTIRRMVILCDCAVQKSPEGIFDVLGRNFPDVGELRWWLIKIGKPRLAELVKGKDLVDAVRIAANELHRDLKETIGRPVARW